MANPQPTDSHLRLANSILEQLLFRKLTQNQLNIIYFILRLSYACGKKFALIKNKRRFELAGIHPNYITQELAYLEENKVLIVYSDLNVYVLNKNFEEWTIPYKKGFTQKAFNDALNENLRTSQQFIDTVNNLLSHSIKNVDTLNNLCGVFNAENIDTEQEAAPPITSIIVNNYNASSSSEESEQKKNFLTELSRVENYPIDEKKDSSLFDSLNADYPDLDLLDALKTWAVSKLDAPLKKTDKPRLQIINWIKKGHGWGHYQKKQNVSDLNFSLEKAREEFGEAVRVVY